MAEHPPKERTWTEQIEIAGSELVDRVKKLVEEGNVRSVIIRAPDGRKLLEIPLTAGVIAGGASAIILPWLTALGVIAALLARVQVEITRTGGNGKA